MKKIPQKLIVRQFLFETEGWERLINYLQQEIVAYKSRLAEIAEFADEEELAAAEKFLDEFMSQDQVLCFLTRELNKQSELLNNESGIKDNQLEGLKFNQEKILGDIQKEGIIFSKVKNRFSSYLAKFIHVGCT